MHTRMQLSPGNDVGVHLPLTLLPPHGKLPPAILRTLRWRILPILWLSFLLSMACRSNISLAVLQMGPDIGVGEGGFGLASGLLLLAFVLFQVPIAQLAHIIGAPASIALQQLCWGLAAAATGLVRTPSQLYIARFLLGASQAGFFPTVSFYISEWFPGHVGEANSFFIAGAVVGTVVGSATGGVLMQALDSVGGLAGWRWLFFLQAAPSLLLPLIVIRFLPRTPADAGFLSPRDRQILSSLQQSSSPMRSSVSRTCVETAKRSPTYLIGIVNFGLQMLGYAAVR